MTTPRRQRKWFNERNQLTLASGAQDSVTVSTTGFDKGETLVRELLTVSVQVPNQNITVEVAIALWVGQFGGIPTDISADSSESYMLWDGWAQEEGTPGGVIHMVRSYDLKGQRSSRSDSENVHFVLKYVSGAAGTMLVTLYTRMLVLLP